MLPPVVVEITRGQMIESSHRAFACIVRSDNKVLMTLGDPEHMAFMRSSAKPLQAAAMIKSGLTQAYSLTTAEIAIICGSHGGESIHVDTVRSLLAKAKLSADDLQCGTHPPLDASARRELDRKGISPSPLHHNCSGKHSGMLLTAKMLGIDLDDYLNPNSRHQREITSFIGEISEFDSEQIEIALDGCSAPVHALPLRNAALAFARLAEPYGLSTSTSDALRTAASAMRKHPEMVAACQGRICTELIRAGSPTALVAKGGAEGYYAVGWRDEENGLGIGLTVKVEDGAQRARDPIVIALLSEFGAIPYKSMDSLKNFAAQPVRNSSGRIVGEVKVVLDDARLFIKN